MTEETKKVAEPKEVSAGIQADISADAIPVPKPVPNEVPKDASGPVKRQIIIETDGSNITLIKAEVAGDLELRAILQTLLENFVKK